MTPTLSETNWWFLYRRDGTIVGIYESNEGSLDKDLEVLAERGENTDDLLYTERRGYFEDVLEIKPPEDVLS